MTGDASIRTLAADDAVELVSLFRRCYGDTYGTAVFYDPVALHEMIASRRLQSVVASSGRRLLGHTGLTVRHPGSLVCETGNTVVDPAARGQGLLRRLGAALRELVQLERYIGYVHYPTTAHEIMQRSSVTGGGRETGVMLSYVPADTEYTAVDRQDGRLAATVVYQPFTAAPQRRVVLPERYRALIVGCYDDLELARTERAATRRTVGRASAVLVHAFNPRRDVLQVFVEKTGNDLAARIESLLAEHNPAASFVDLVLDEPLVDESVTALVKLGFFYCGLLPEFARTDLLRLQRLRQASAADFTPALVNDDARRLCAFMRSEAFA